MARPQGFTADINRHKPWLDPLPAGELSTVLCLPESHFLHTENERNLPPRAAAQRKCNHAHRCLSHQVIRTCGCSGCCLRVGFSEDSKARV